MNDQVTGHKLLLDSHSLILLLDDVGMRDQTFLSTSSKALGLNAEEAPTAHITASASPIAVDKLLQDFYNGGLLLQNCSFLA